MKKILTPQEAQKEAQLIQAWNKKRLAWRAKVKKGADELKKSQPHLTDQQRALMTIEKMVKQHIEWYQRAGQEMTETDARKIVENIAYMAEKKTKKA